MLYPQPHKHFKEGKEKLKPFVFNGLAANNEGRTGNGYRQYQKDGEDVRLIAIAKMLGGGMISIGAGAFYFIHFRDKSRRPQGNYAKDVLLNSCKNSDELKIK